MAKNFIVETSARHVHVSRRVLDILFQGFGTSGKLGAVGKTGRE